MAHQFAGSAPPATAFAATVSYDATYLTFAPSEKQYQAITDTRNRQEWIGYWVYFDQPTAVFYDGVSHFGGRFESSPLDQ